MAYGDRRQPTTPSQRRTYNMAGARLAPYVGRVPMVPRATIARRHYPGKVPFLGQAVTEVASEATSALNGVESALSSLGLTGAPHGSPNDPRVQLLTAAYSQALAGMNSTSPYPGTGTGYLQNWLNDSPPHPDYSNELASKLLAGLTNPAAAAALASDPQVATAGIPVTGQLATGGLGGLFSSPIGLLVVVGIVWAVTRK